MTLVYENAAIIKAVALTMLCWIYNILNNFQMNQPSITRNFAFKDTRTKSLTYKPCIL